jgi:hypothetical protein
MEPRANGVRLQIAEHPPTLRADRHHLITWLNGHNLPASVVIKQMERDLSAKQGRGTLAGGTKYSSGRVFVVDVPLVTDALETQLMPKRDHEEHHS